MWVQEEESSRELQYHKVNASENGADLFTKALEHDSIRRHTEAMGCEFMIGRDPIALTVNNLSAKVNMEKLAMEVECGFVDKNGLAQQNLHKQRVTDLERRCIHGAC